METLSQAWSNVTIARLLRRDMLAIAASTIKVLCCIAALLTLLALTKDFFERRLETQTLTSKLSSSLADIKTRSTTSTSPKAHVKLTVITERSLFGSLAPANPMHSDAPQVQKTPLNLIGTYTSVGAEPYAIIEDDKKKQQDVFGLHEKVFGEATITAITADRVELDRNGAKEILLLDDTPDGGAPGTSGGNGDQIAIEEQEFTKAMENLPLLLTQARAVPYFKDGKAEGLRLFALKAGSFYERLGLKNGDILKTINGNSLADLSQAVQLFDRLKAERSFTITLERNSEAKEMHYDVH